MGNSWFLFGDEFEKVDVMNKENGIENSGLQSVFDKQLRLDLIQGIAEDENGVNFPFIEKISRVHRTADEKGFCLNVYPNIYISDQTTKRLGDLIYDKYNEDQNSDFYWARHKIILAALSIFKGPITLYYGDEIGFSTNQSSITENELIQRKNDLHQFTQKILNARLNHPAMYCGIYNRSFPSNNVHINYKLYIESIDRIVFISTLSSQQITVEYKLECFELVDVITGEIIKGINGTFSISIPAFGVRIFTADDNNITDDTVVSEKKKIELKNNLQISSSDAKKTSVLVSVIGSLCIVLIITLVIGITVYTLTKKKNEKLEEYDNGYTNV